MQSCEKLKSAGDGKLLEIKTLNFEMIFGIVADPFDSISR